MNLQYSQYEQYFKVIIVGNAGTGKTCIIQTYEKGVKPNHVNPTVGVEYSSKVINLSNNRKVKLQIWDTAGQQQYRSVTINHYKNSAGALVVFDVTNRTSFNDVIRWISDIRDRCNENVVIGIVGNKTDLNRRQVSRQEAENLASKQQAFYMETSINNVQSIRSLFQRLAQEISRSNKTKNLQFSRTNVELSNPKKESSNCQC